MNLEHLSSKETITTEAEKKHVFLGREREVKWSNCFLNYAGFFVFSFCKELFFRKHFSGG